tara:strand:- start:250 stop:495 length:246 start_codon:yes stop_codon:yes gene_type:complete
MGKKRAAITALRSIADDARDEITYLNQTLNNIKVLLSRETEKNAALQEEVDNLKKQISKSKTSTKKTRSSKKADSTKVTEE